MTYKTTLSFNTLHYESKKMVGHTLVIVQIVSDYPHCKLMYNNLSYQIVVCLAIYILKWVRKWPVIETIILSSKHFTILIFI